MKLMQRLRSMHAAMHGCGFNTRLFRLIERTLKVAVITSDFIMTQHCLFLLMGYDPWVGEILCGYCLFGTVILFLASYLLHFCWRYRLAVLHTFAVNFCITWEREFGFGSWLIPMCVTMLVLGVFIIMANLKAYLKQ